MIYIGFTYTKKKSPLSFELNLINDGWLYEFFFNLQ